MSDVYTVKDVARIFGLQEARLRYWAQTGFVGPSIRRAGRTFYSFQDLIGVKVAKELIDGGLPLQRVRKNLDALREALPHLDRPLAALRVCSDGERVVVVNEDKAFEPESGQLVLSFAVDALNEQVTQVLSLAGRTGVAPAPPPATAPAPPGPDLVPPAARVAPPAPSAHRPGPAPEPDVPGPAPPDDGPGPASEVDLGGRLAEALDGVTADDAGPPAAAPAAAHPGRPPRRDAGRARTGYASFLEGLRAEELGDDGAAEAHYRRATALDVGLAAAWTNLGNVLERRGARGEAREAYDRALALDPDQPEARFNLANVLADIGEVELAMAEYRRVTGSCPEFADAHFNLALLYARVGASPQARMHLARYLDLDGAGVWADRAREFLAALEAPGR